MRININMACLTEDLFMEGSNLGKKIGIGQPKQPIAIQYDTALLSMIVQYKGLVALIPFGGIASMTVTNPKDIDVESGPAPAVARVVPSHPAVAPAPVTAQVEIPTQPKVGNKGK